MCVPGGSERRPPHGYANRKVLTDLAARLHLGAVTDISRVDLDALNAAAGQMIREDTATRLWLGG